LLAAGVEANQFVNLHRRRGHTTTAHTHMQSVVLSTQQQQQKVDKRSKPAAAELLETLHRVLHNKPHHIHPRTPSAHPWFLTKNYTTIMVR
jgi:hypothetical protein